MDKSQRPPLTAFMIAVAVSITSWTVSRTTADDAASSAAQHAAEQQFDGRFFDARRDPSVEAAQTRLTRVLKTRIEAIDRSCGLDASQTKKLELAGRAVIKRLFDSIAERKQVFLSEGRTTLPPCSTCPKTPRFWHCGRNCGMGLSTRNLCSRKPSQIP